MRVSHLACLVTAATVVAAAPAAAAPEPWQPYRAVDFVAPAGKYCAFDLAVTAVEDGEEYRVAARYPGGAERVVEYRGTLITRFTNVATGESVVRDLSGHAWEERYPDGGPTKSFTGVGPFGFGFRAGDDFAQGYYRLDGVNVVTIAPDGTRALPVNAGTAENLCDTLAT